jgi:hypothetical protein
VILDITLFCETVIDVTYELFSVFVHIESDLESHYKDPCKLPGAPSEIDRDKKLIILDPTTGINMILARRLELVDTSQDTASSSE